MKYTNEIIINAPRSRVVELMDNADNMKLWQPDLIHFETISGVQGQNGAKSRLVFPRMEMIETITNRNFPEEFDGQYEVKGMLNNIKNRFYEVDAKTTKWWSENEFIPSGFMMKAMCTLMPFLFKAQTQKTMEQFKRFVENAK